MLKNPLSKKLYTQRYLLLMSIPFVIWLIIFKYIPLTGWIMAFQDYKPHLGIFNQKWVGLSFFKELFNEPLFYQSLKNTLGMSLLGLVFGFITSIGFALLLNELRFVSFKRFTQTVSYLPHFVSWVVTANIVISMLSLNGPINELMMQIGLVTEETKINFMAKPEFFWFIVVFSDIWKEVGWGAIIYLAAMTGIDSQIYEAAEIDGVNRLQKIWYITLPGISATIVLLLILNIGNIINIGFEKQMLLSNTVTSPKALVLDMYALKYGIEGDAPRFSFGTAIGIFKSVVSVILLFLANHMAKRSGKGSLF